MLYRGFATTYSQINFTVILTASAPQNHAFVCDVSLTEVAPTICNHPNKSYI